MNDGLDKGSRLWMYKYCHRQYWRVASQIDFDDLIQEGFAAYYDTVRRYPNATDVANLQSLFKLVFRSRIEDLARKSTRQVKLDPEGASVLDNVLPSSEVDRATVLALIVKAPPRIRRVVELLLLSDEPLKYVKSISRKQTLNEFLCGKFGLNPKRIDLVEQARTYFQGAWV